MQLTLACIHLAPRTVFALLFVMTKGVGRPEKPLVGKELIELWLHYRMENCVAIKSEAGKKKKKKVMLMDPDIKKKMLMQ